MLSFLAYTKIATKEIYQKRTIKREMDPIIVTGREMEKFLGYEIENIYVYVYKENKFQPIPYQIDERDKNNDYIFTNDKKESQDDDKGLFDENDELVFMSKDLGDEIFIDDIPKIYEDILEVQVIDPLTLENGWAYVFYSKEKREISSEDYIQYVPSEEKIYARNYTAGFDEKAPIAFNHLSITPLCNGTGDNLIDRLKIRFYGNVFLGLKVKANEEEFTSEVIGFIDGQIRVIRRTKNRVFFYGIFGSPSAISDGIFYYSHLDFPFVVDIPFDVKDLFLSAQLRVTVESKDAFGIKFYNEHNLQGVDVDGVMKDDERKLNFSPSKWLAIAGTKQGNTGSWINRILIQSPAPVKPNLFYIDDVNISDPPENIPGQMGNVGYFLDKFEWVEKGFHKFTCILYVLPKYEIGDEKIILDIIDNPVKLWIK